MANLRNTLLLGTACAVMALSSAAFAQSATPEEPAAMGTEKSDAAAPAPAEHKAKQHAKKSKGKHHAGKAHAGKGHKKTDAAK